MKHILIAGASGYIGSILTPYLCALGHQVTAVDMKFQPGALREACVYPNLKIVKANCLAAHELEPLIVEADVIYWLIGVTGNKSIEEMRLVNVASAKLLTQFLWSSQTVVFPNTNAGYVPSSGEATEDDTMIGRTPYSTTKIEAENILMATGQCVSFRLAAIYGPAPVIRWETLLNHMILQSVQSAAPFKIFQSHAKRDVLFSQDLAERLALPLQCDLRGEIYNLSGQSLAKIDFLREVFRLTGEKRTYEIVDGDDPEQRNFAVSEEKYKRKRRAEGVYPVLTTELQAGIEATIKAARLEL